MGKSRKDRQVTISAEAYRAAERYGEGVEYYQVDRWVEDLIETAWRLREEDGIIFHQMGQRACPEFAPAGTPCGHLRLVPS